MSRTRRRMPKAVYEEELARLQVQLVEMQRWIMTSGVRIVALTVPTEREKGQWYVQRHLEHLPKQVPVVEKLLVDDGIILLKYWFAATDTEHAPWWTIDSDDKRAARLNVIPHLLSQVPFEKLKPEKVSLPKRPEAVDYVRPPVEVQRFVPDHAAGLAS